MFQTRANMIIIRTGVVSTVSSRASENAGSHGAAEPGGGTIVALNKRCWYHPSPGGSEINLEETLTRLSQRGNNVTLLTGAFPECARNTTDSGVEIQRIGPRRQLGGFWDDLLAYLLVTIYAHIYLFRHDIDAVYVVNTPLPWLVFTSKPLVAIFHHLALDSVYETHEFPIDRLIYLGQWLGVQHTRGKMTVSVSASTTKALCDLGQDPERIREVHNGINIEDYPPADGEAKSESPRLVFLGGLEPYKGADRLPTIHASVEERSEASVELDIVGRDGTEGERIKEYCERVESATYHGFASEERKVELLRSAWLLVAPSRVEGWGMAVIEANACRTPAVATDVRGLRDSVRDGETGETVPWRDGEEFSAAVHALLEDDERRERLADEARTWAEHHSWEQSASELEDALYEAMRASRAT